jgi:hypothetical protein
VNDRILIIMLILSDRSSSIEDPRHHRSARIPSNLVRKCLTHPRPLISPPKLTPLLVFHIPQKAITSNRSTQPSYILLRSYLFPPDRGSPRPGTESTESHPFEQPVDLERFCQGMEEREVTCRAEVDGRGKFHVWAHHVAEYPFIILVSVYSSFTH